MTTESELSHAHAMELFNANLLDQALAIYKQLFTLNREDAQAWHMASAIAGMTGDYASAKTYSEQAIILSPQSHGPRLNLANILQLSGDLQGAMYQFKKALELNPGDPQTQTDIAKLHARLGEFKLAESQLQIVIQETPGYADAYNALGNVYRETSRTDAAANCFQQAISLKPDYVDALCNLGAVLVEQLRFKDADSCYSAALRYQPENSSILHGYGNLHQSTGDYDKAKACYQQALILNPADTGLTSSLASLYERCGEQDSASELLEPLIKSRQFTPDAAITYAKLCSKDGNYEAAIRTLKDALEETRSPGKIIDIYFSLGELYDRSGEYDEAFDYFKRANELDTNSVAVQDYSAYVKVISEFYNSQRWPILPRSSNKSELPVFIVGMQRTGTSLVEQILASHPQVSPGGERNDIFTIVDSLQSISEPTSNLPGLLEKLTAEQLDKLSNKHLASIELLSKGHLRFTDKTPLHGILLGFINQLLPGSRVIVCNRNPLDTCLSIYFHRFNAFHGYAKHLDTLGALFREYHALIAHWINILDIDILQVQYEELVRDPDENIRNVIGFCGLDWDDNCLAFHRNKRTVNTPSYNQVRRPIYTSSIERWKHYDKHLGSLRTALETDNQQIIAP
jgi:tetratricopeptide (TPR) repeat protein